MCVRTVHTHMHACAHMETRSRQVSPSVPLSLFVERGLLTKQKAHSLGQAGSGRLRPAQAVSPFTVLDHRHIAFSHRAPKTQGPWCLPENQLPPASSLHSWQSWLTRAELTLLEIRGLVESNTKLLSEALVPTPSPSASSSAGPAQLAGLLSDQEQQGPGCQLPHAFSRWQEVPFCRSAQTFL